MILFQQWNILLYHISAPVALLLAACFQISGSCTDCTRISIPNFADTCDATMTYIHYVTQRDLTYRYMYMYTCKIHVHIFNKVRRVFQAQQCIDTTPAVAYSSIYMYVQITLAVRALNETVFVRM